MGCDKCDNDAHDYPYRMGASGSPYGVIIIRGCEFHVKMALDKLQRFDETMEKIRLTMSEKVHEINRRVEKLKDDYEKLNADYDNLLFKFRTVNDKGFTFK